MGNRPSLSSDESLWTDRQGLATFTKLAFAGVSLKDHWDRLVAYISDDARGAGLGMDLSAISQLMGDQPTGLAIQRDSLCYQRLYRSRTATGKNKLRLLAIAAAMDIGGNTPVEFLLDGSDVELITLYVVPGVPLPDKIPDHDIAMVVAPDDARCRDALGEMKDLLENWPRPVLNLPQNILDLDRHKLCRKLGGLPGLEIPLTEVVTRDWLMRLSHRPSLLVERLGDGRFPLIIRPIGSHAGLGLRKLETAEEIHAYLAERPEPDFFISRYIDYSSADGLFRKYRILLIDGRAYACHMAIADQWKIWYLNADMLGNPANRGEEAAFMALFDEEFATRHAPALRLLADRLGLDYCTVDCAETKAGELLIFEADNTAIVHDMDPVDTFPYKAPQMRKVFGAFVQMLYRRAGRQLASAA